MEFASFIYVIVVNICLQNIFVDSITGTLIPPASYEDLVGIHTTYYAMGFEHTWYEARDVCQSIGGDLAKLPSEDIIIAMKNNNSDVESFFTSSKHYFTSAVRLREDMSVWSSECSEFNLNMTAPSVTSYKDGFTTPVCLSIHGDHFHNEDCNNARKPFLCETKTRTCKMVDTFDTEIIQFNYMDKSECNRLCDADATCWAAIATPTHCIMATVSGYGLATLSMSTKQCTHSFAVQYHETNNNLVNSTVSYVAQSAGPPHCTPSVPTTPPIPTSTTTTTTQSTTTTPPPTTSGTTSPKAISPTPPQIVTSTVTVMSTDIVVSTVVVRSTDVVVSTTIVTSIKYDTAHVTPTQIVVCSTEKVTTTTTATATVTAQVCSSSIPSSALTTATLSSVWVLDNEAIDRKNTSNYRRSLTSAMDFRATSSLIGGFGVTLIIIPLVAFILSDIRAIVRHWRRHESIYNISKNDSKPEI